MSFAPDKKFKKKARPKSANYMMNSAKEMFPLDPPKSATRPSSPGGLAQGHRTLKTATKAEAAVAVMKRLAEVAGEQVVVRGNSIFDSLGYLRTDPAVVVLKNKQWREFFAEMQQEEEQQARASTGRLDTTQATVADTSPESPSKPERPDYPRLHRKLVRRVHHLWNDLRIPESDRDFYGYNLLKTRFESPHQLIDIAEYIRTLQAQRKVTMFVLKTIAARENILQQALELLASVQRRGIVKFADEEKSVIWKSDFLQTINALQQHNIKTIQAIQYWRQTLCRPFPFIYEGRNYLKKIATDMDVLKSDTFQRLLESIEIDPRCLNCVVFHIPIEAGSLQSSQVLDTSIDLSLDVSATQVAAEYDEAEEAAQVVLNEFVLQRAITMERKALLARGVFMPTIKFECDTMRFE